MDKIYETKVLRHLVTKLLVILERHELNEVSPPSVPVDCLGKVHRPQSTLGEPRQSTLDSLSWRNGAQSGGRTRWLEFAEHWRGEHRKEREFWRLQRVPRVVSRVLLRTSLWRNYLKLRKEPSLEKIIGNNAWIHTGLGIEPVLPVRLKISWLTALGRGHRGLASEVRNNWP